MVQNGGNDTGREPAASKGWPLDVAWHLAHALLARSTARSINDDASAIVDADDHVHGGGPASNSTTTTLDPNEDNGDAASSE